MEQGLKASSMYQNHYLFLIEIYTRDLGEMMHKDMHYLYCIICTHIRKHSEYILIYFC